MHDPLLAAVILTATSLGLVIPVLKEGGHIDSRLGQLVIAGASIGDFSAVILLSLLFSKDSSDTTTKLVLLGVFVLAIGVVVVALTRHSRGMKISNVLVRLQDTTAQIRVRGAVLLLVLLVVLAENLGLETILGAFVAGAVVSLVDRDAGNTHPLFRVKLEAIGYGFLVPVFFITSGMRFDLNALLDDPSTLALVPVFLAALLLVRGLPAIVYRPLVGTRSSVAAGPAPSDVIAVHRRGDADRALDPRAHGRDGLGVCRRGIALRSGVPGRRARLVAHLRPGPRRSLPTRRDAGTDVTGARTL